MGFALSGDATLAIRADVLSQYPNEACGLVVEGTYVPCTNYAADTTKDFKIAGADIVAQQGRKIDAVVHSHPTANGAPSANDMTAQINSNLPFVIVPCNGKTCGEFVIFGTGVDVAPLVGRSFVHGVADCYSAVRDIFRLGKDAVAEQGFRAWPFDPVALPEVPRDDSWWGEPGKPGLDLYAKGFGPAGFIKIAREECQPGDAFFCKIRSDQYNHAGVLVSKDLIFHHLPGRLSRREPAGLWARAADVWLRYKGTSSAA